MVGVCLVHNRHCLVHNRHMNVGWGCGLVVSGGRQIGLLLSSELGLQVLDLAFFVLADGLGGCPPDPPEVSGFQVLLGWGGVESFIYSFCYSFILFCCS